MVVIVNCAEKLPVPSVRLDGEKEQEARLGNPLQEKVTGPGKRAAMILSGMLADWPALTVGDGLEVVI